MNLLYRIDRLGIVLLSVALLSCGGEQPAQDTLSGVDPNDSTAENMRVRKTNAIFYSIPSPMETAGLLKRAGAEYQMNILNDVNNVGKYTSASKQALNLGVYGADLSYASVYNHTNESMLFTSCARKLADRLGVMGAFDDRVIERMQSNIQDRDSLLDIVSETYWNMDAYLKENERENISALMIAGGWVEGLYIATQVAGTKGSDEMRQRIAEQRLSLNDLVGLVGTYEDGTDGALKEVTRDLVALQAIYAQTPVATAGSTVTQEGGVTVIGGGDAPATLTDKQLEELRLKVAEIRNSYIN